MKAEEQFTGFKIRILNTFIQNTLVAAGNWNTELPIRCGGRLTTFTLILRGLSTCKGKTSLEQSGKKYGCALKLDKLGSIWQWTRIQKAQISLQLPNIKAGNTSFSCSAFPNSEQAFSQPGTLAKLPSAVTYSLGKLFTDGAPHRYLLHLFPPVEGRL